MDLLGIAGIFLSHISVNLVFYWQNSLENLLGTCQFKEVCKYKPHFKECKVLSEQFIGVNQLAPVYIVCELHKTLVHASLSPLRGWYTITPAYGTHKNPGLPKS